MSSETITINRLSDLAGISFATARKRLEVAGAKPGADGRYDLGEAVRAILASRNITESRQKLIEAQRERIEMETEREKGGLYEGPAIYRAFEALFHAVGQKIKNSSMTQVEKDDLFRDLQTVGSIRIKSDS